MRELIHQKLSENSNQNESVWNIFVQVMLPLIMILTFSSVTLVLKYKNQADEAINDSRDCASIIKELEDEFDPEHHRRRSEKLILEIQLQKLLKALKEVELEQRLVLELGRCKFQKDINVAKGKLNDEGLKAFCSNFNNVVFNELYDVKREYYKRLYDDILEKASIIDNEGRRIRFQIVEQNIDEIFESEYVRASERVINDKIRLYLITEIVKLVNSFKQEVVEYQKHIVLRLIETMIEKKPEDLSDELRTIIDKFMRATNEGRTEAMEEFYREMMRSMIEDLERYHILPFVISEIDNI